MEVIKCIQCKCFFYDSLNPDFILKQSCESVLSFNDNNSYIISHYGSSFDTNKFNIEPQSSLYKKEGDICDNCIQQLLDKKEIVKDNSFDYWDSIQISDLEADDFDKLDITHESNDKKE